MIFERSDWVVWLEALRRTPGCDCKVEFDAVEPKARMRWCPIHKPEEFTITQT
jgi:hypothetical protein